MNLRRYMPLLLRFLRLPPKPACPHGNEKSLQVFRAAPAFLKYQLVIWCIAHAVFTLIMVGVVVALIVAAVGSRDPEGAVVFSFLALLMSLLLPVSLLVSYLCVFVDYDMRWYMVTDRSLRIREGVFYVREATMTFANIQNIEISQGPIQRWLGIADVKVHSAGGAGGGGTAGGGGSGQPMFNMHVALFRGVDNAESIVAMMDERLRSWRSAGLGDPDDDRETPMTVPATGGSQPGSLSAVAAARDLLDECRGLRVGLGGGNTEEVNR